MEALTDWIRGEYTDGIDVLADLHPTTFAGVQAKVRGDNQDGFGRQSGWMISGQAGGWA
jgi:hypothetical protein